MSVAGALAGHWWTVAPVVRAGLAPPPVPPSEPFRITIEDPTIGSIPLGGALHVPAGARALVVALHGLGGTSESSYIRRFASAAVARGFACLRFNLRGADGSAPDYYHAGLTRDVAAALAAPALARFEAIALVGFSLGGQVALRWAGELGAAGDPRLAAIAAVCSPVDLERGATALDASANAPYRAWILSGMRALADAVERFRPLPVDRAARRRIRTIREWDHRLVAPRWGFASAEDYYARASAAPLLGEIRRPTWIVLAEHDPMVPAASVRPALGDLSPAVTVTWSARGGHVGFPAGLDLGQPGARGLASQVLTWLGGRLSQGEVSAQGVDDDQRPVLPHSNPSANR